ncbi:MAG: hypothetical protein GXN96_06785 [Aquificae bacterium]|nr:hypothetical protein [Aquificota bacterium]
MAAYLEEVIASIVSSLVRAKAAGDVASYEVAEIYRKDGVLGKLPVPKINIEKVEIELKVAIDGLDRQPPQERARLLLEETLSLLEGVENKYPQVKKLKESPELRRELEKKLAESLSRKGKVDKEEIAKLILGTPKKERKFSVAGKREKEVVEIAAQLKLPRYLLESPPLRIKARVTAQELQEVSPDAVITVKLELYGEDIEPGDGEVTLY